MDDTRFRLRVFLAVTVAVMALGLAGLMITEDLGLGDALYFSIVTLTTVGYGDITPQTGWGRALAVVMILAGVGAFMGVVANFTEVLLSRRDRENRRNKAHMVMSVFFSEMGGELLRVCAAADTNPEELNQCLSLDGKWGPERFDALEEMMRGRRYRVDLDKLDKQALERLLFGNGDFLLRLLENPLLTESEAFSGVLLAIFHLRDELLHRRGLCDLPRSDLAHQAGDIGRVYRMLTEQWLNYSRYLAIHYPYLFSMAVRTNPFCAGEPDVVVRD